LTGNVTVNITSDLTGELGTNGLNALTEQPTGSNFTVKIYPTGAARAITGSFNGALIRLNGASRVTIDGSIGGTGTDRSLTITNTSVTTPSVVLLGSTGTTPITNDTLRNCVVINGVNTSSAVVISDAGTLGSTGFFSNITIQNNDIQKAYVGVFATGGTTPQNGSNLTYTQNTVNTSGANAVRCVALYMQGVNGATVSQNTVGNLDKTNDENDVGIWLATGTINATVSGNTLAALGYTGTGAYAPVGINVTSGVTATNNDVTGNSVSDISSSGSNPPRGISVSGTAADLTVQKNSVQGVINTNTSTYGAYGIDITAGNNIAVKNNFVSNVTHNMTGGAAFSTTYGVFGIRVGQGNGIQVYNNSVNLYGLMPGTATASLLSAAFALVGTASTGCDVRNNIFANNITGGTTSIANVSVYLPSGGTSAMNLTWNNNAYYFGADAVRQGLGQAGATAGTNFYTTLPALAAYSSTLSPAATNDNASLASSAAVPFVSATDLHLQPCPATSPAVGAGTLIPSVTVDIDGQARSATAPDIGADEIVKITVTDPAVTTGSVGIFFSQAFTQSGGTAPVTFTTASALPTGLTLAADGTLSGTPTSSGTFPITVTATDANGCTGAGTVYNLVISCPTITLAPGTLPGGTQGIAYNQTIAASPSGTPYTYSVTSGSLPPGLSLDTNTGALTGTPTTTGAYTFTITATGWVTCTGSRAYSLVVTDATGCMTNALTQTFDGVTAPALPSPWSTAVIVPGTGVPPIWTTSAGGTNPTATPVPSSPNVLSFNSFDCDAGAEARASALSPMDFSPYGSAQVHFKIYQYWDGGIFSSTSEGVFVYASTNGITWSVQSALITNADPSLPTGTGHWVSQTVDLSAYHGQATVYVGLLGVSQFGYNVHVDDISVTGSCCPTITATNPAVTTGTAGVPFSQTFTQSGGIAPVTFSTASALPTGLTLATDGTLSGTPTVTGTFPITVIATDANGCTGTGPVYTLTVAAQADLAITKTDGVTTVTPGGSTTYTITASNAGPSSTTGSVADTFPAVLSGTWTCVGAGGGTCTAAGAGNINDTVSLPAGGSVTYTVSASVSPSATGTLSNTATVSGAATDSNPSNNSATDTDTVVCPVITVTNPAVTTGMAGVPFSQSFTQNGGIAPVTFSTASALPAGLALASDGTLSGTPTVTGTFPITVTATDTNACAGTGSTYTLVLTCAGYAVPELIYYKFDQAGQTAVTNLASAPVGTNPAPFMGGLAMGGSGQFGAGLIGTGNASSTDYVNTGWATNVGTGSWTISLWLTDSPGTTTLYYYFGDATANSFRCFTNGVAGPNNLILRGAGLTDVLVNSVWPGPAVITFAYDAAAHEVRAYSNGVLATTVAQGAVNLSGTGPFKVCGYATNVGLGPGQLMDEFRLYNRALGAAEVAAVAASTLPASSIAITNPAITTGTVNAPFSQTFTQSGGIAPVTFSTASPLPAGLSLAANGTLSGTPTVSGTFPIIVTVIDNNGCTGTGSVYNLVISCQTITVTNPAVTTGTAGVPFSQTFTQSGGIAPVTFSTASALPTGLTLATDGTLSGTPTVTGAFPITVTVTDANGCTGSGALYTLMVDAQADLSVTKTDTPDPVAAGQNITYTITVTNSGPSDAAGVSLADTFPPGLTFVSQVQNSGPAFVLTNTATSISDTLASFAAGASATFTVVVGVPAAAINGTIYSNAVNVTASTTDPNFGNNSAMASTTVSTPPAVTGVSPNNGPTVGGTTVTITGSAFTGATAVRFGATPAAPFTVVNANQITATTPPHAVGTVDVTVTTPAGTSTISAADQFTYTCAAIIVSPPTLPNGQVGMAYNQTLTAAGGVGPYTYLVTTGVLPNGLGLAAGGALTGTPTVPGSFAFTVTATDSLGCTGTTATYTLMIGCQTITVTNPAVATGTVNSAFSQTFTQSNAVLPVTFTTASTLPAGLALAVGGTLSGTPTQTGTFPITVTATDTNGCTGTGEVYTLVIGCQTITVTNPAVATGTVNSAFSQTFTQSNAVLPVTFTTASTLPAGLALAVGGTLSGTPTQTGSFPITVTATDTNGCTGTGAIYTLVIGCPPITLTPATLPDALAGAAYSQALTAAPAGTTYTYAVTAGALPPGMTLSSAGLLNGAPTFSGPFAFTVTATGWGTCTGSQAYTLTVTCPAITLSPATLPGGVVGSPYSATLTASGGHSPYTFAVTSGTLPAGLTLGTDGSLTGTLASGGAYSFTVTATDAYGCTGTATYTTGVDSFDLSFLDDGGATQLCLNTYNGTYAFTIFSGTGAGTYAGLCTVAPGRLGMMAVTSYGSRTVLSGTYSPLRHVAQATFTTPGRGTERAGGILVPTVIKATLSGSNTLDDPPCGGGEPAR